MPSRSRMPVVLALIALAFVGTQLVLEHLGGGVRSHHLLNRPDLPAISNWLGLLTLPALGFALGMRIRRAGGFTAAVWTGLVASLLYGTALATGFEFGAGHLTQGLFLGLFVVAILAPVYRAECMVGFVAGMTFTFGAVLPFLVALVFAAISAAVRVGSRALLRRVRPGRAATGAR